jgi:phosphatidylglycerophosphate synthase
MSKTTLRENIYTIPNILTASRLVAAPFIGYCILHDYHATALALFAYAGITDALDGWIARRWNLGTVVGTVIDPMADKTLMTVLTVALAMKGALPGTSFLIFTHWAPLTNHPSLARRNHSRPRRRPGHLGHLLPLDLAAAAQDVCALLGLLAALGRGAPDHHQQGQHGAAAGADGADHPRPCHPGRGYEHAVGHHAVSCGISFFFPVNMADPGQVRRRDDNHLERC